MPKILVIRFSSIGDIVLTTPVVRCLHQQLAHVQIHYLTKAAFAPLLAHNPYIEQVHTLQPSVWASIGALRNEGFDAIIDLHHNLRTAWIKAGLWSVPAYSYPKLNLQKWLATQWKRTESLPAQHIVDRYLSTTVSWNIQNDHAGLDYFIPPQDQIDPYQYFSQLPPHTPYIALVVGAAHATKRLPAAQLLSLCQQIRQPIVLLGGNDDTAVGKYIAEQAGKHVINACGLLNLNRSAAVLQHAAKVITHDTGLMHIAAALGKPIASVWGNTIPQFGMYPYRAAAGSAMFEVGDLGCRPCSKIGYKSCPKGHFACMNQQNMSAIAQWAAAVAS